MGSKIKEKIGKTFDSLKKNYTIVSGYSTNTNNNNME